METFGRFLKQYGWTTLLFLSLIVALTIMSQILQNASEFADVYSALLISTWFGIAVLLGLFVRTISSLYRKLKAHTPGAKITLRLTILAALLMAIPTITIYAFSMNFIQQGINQWFDVKTETALTNASEVVRYSLDNKTRDSLNLTQAIVQEQTDLLERFPATAVNRLRKLLNAEEVALYQGNQQLVAFSARESTQILPNTPAENLFQQVRQKNTYAAIESSSAELTDNYIRVLIPFTDNFNTEYALQAIFPISSNISALSDSVAVAASQYKELSYLKGPLITSFSLILSMLVLLTLVTAVLFSIRAIDNFASPIRVLTQGTRAISEGDYQVRMPVEEKGEFGELIQSFNEMTEKISQARNDLRLSHQQTEVQKLYLQGVIQNLSSGIITLDGDQRLKSINGAAERILDSQLHGFENQALAQLIYGDHDLSTNLTDLFQQIHQQINGGKANRTWELKFDYHLKNQHKILMIHGSPLPSSNSLVAGYILVFDDITELVQAQLNRAWSDIARRLAHEIKNPLTPIQLSAERLNFKLQNKLPETEKQLLERMTKTIIDQVATMQNLVQAFTDYANTPEVHLQPNHLNDLIASIAEMYHNPAINWRIQLDLQAPETLVLSDLNRLRQLIHNLIKNALEACETSEQPKVTICTRLQENDLFEIQICDNGQGIPEESQNWIFEPYATDKPKGTGLGLAVVRKVVEEHHGQITFKTSPQQGTCFIITLPTVNTKSEAG